MIDIVEIYGFYVCYLVGYRLVFLVFGFLVNLEVFVMDFNSKFVVYGEESDDSYYFER